MIRVVPCGADRVADVLALWRDADAEPTTTDDVESLRTLLAHDAGALLTAVEDDGLIIGAVIAAWDGWRGAFYRLAVAPEHRRQGIARTLVAAGEERLRSLGAARIAVITVGDSSGARAFWRAAGYIEQANRERAVKNLEC